MKRYMQVPVSNGNTVEIITRMRFTKRDHELLMQYVAVEDAFVAHEDSIVIPLKGGDEVFLDMPDDAKKEDFEMLGKYLDVMKDALIIDRR